MATAGKRWLAGHRVRTIADQWRMKDDRNVVGVSDAGPRAALPHDPARGLTSRASAATRRASQLAPHVR
jgi:hypothetical protein